MSDGEAEFIATIEKYKSEGRLPEEHAIAMLHFYPTYVSAATEGGVPLEKCYSLLSTFLNMVVKQLEEPYHFSSLHWGIREPFDFYRFGMDFITPLIDRELSTIGGQKQLARICQQLEAGENVIFTANHQTEPDAQVLSYLLADSYRQIANNLIFVAGHRVVSDPWAVPFSMGCNLFCIWSKKYIDAEMEGKTTKMEHNRRTIAAMQQQLERGGVAIYVAPSGGRDRPDSTGYIDVAPFDPQSVELFMLTARHCARPTHIYPLALSTYSMLPPPLIVQKALGEPRYAHRAGVHLAVGEEWTDSNAIPSNKRQERAEALWNAVRSLYQQLPGDKKQAS